MKSSWGVIGLVVALTFLPRHVNGQCVSGMPSGGHDHDVVPAAANRASGEKQTRQAIDRLLENERGRTMLMEAVLADAAFMREMIRRIAAAPEWRALAAERLAAPVASPTTAHSDSARGHGSSQAPKPDAALYRCPMHPDVTMAGPGKCEKCGMALRRKT